MRICTNCFRASLSRDTYCPYCGRTPYSMGRICERGHSNPVQASFCGTCGSSNLSEPAPPAPVWWYLVGIVVIVALLFLGWIILSRGVPMVFSSVLEGIYSLLMPFILLIMIFVLITLFLPKRTGRNARGGLFSILRFCFKGGLRVISSILRMGIRLLSSSRGSDSRRR